MAKKTPLQIEMERRTNDLVRVYNPTDEDYVVAWDRRDGAKLFRVKSKQEAVLIRYIAEKYMREMYQKIVDEKIQKAIIAENQKRISSGQRAMDKTMATNEQLQFEEGQMPSDTEAAKIMATLWVGVEQEYGIDSAVPKTQEEQPDPSKTQIERVMDRVQDRDTSNGVTEKKEQTAEELRETTKQDVFKCDYPDCDFEAKSQAGLLSHKRSHRNDDAKKQAVAQVSA